MHLDILTLTGQSGRFLICPLHEERKLQSYRLTVLDAHTYTHAHTHTRTHTHICSHTHNTLDFTLRCLPS